MNGLSDVGIATRITGGGSVGKVGREFFPNPWLDYASLEMPKNLTSVLQWAEFIWLTNGTFRMACERVVRYFLTKIEIEDVDDEAAEKYKDFLEKTLKATEELACLGDDFLCFHGDVKATTRNGVFKLRDLKGKTVDVLSQGGVYRPAKFKSFGQQSLLEIRFSDGRTILATPEHRWIVKNCAGKIVELPTSKLIPGHRIPRAVAPRPEKNEEYSEGVRHGFVFGDGTTYNGGKQAAANFFGKKDKALLPYFEKCRKPRYYKGYCRIHGLPAHYKQLPENTVSASYWYGFVCGFLAADGSVDTHGCALFTQKSKAALEVIVEQLPRIGMVAGSIRGHRRKAILTRYNGKTAEYDSVMHYVTLLKQSMDSEDFLIESHKKKFKKKYKPTCYGQFIGIEEVVDTGLVDEVFCCVEPETHTFVVDNGILTKQCYGNSFSSLLAPFDRFLRCPECNLERPIEKVIYNFTSDFKFLGACPGCKKKVTYIRKDRRSSNDSEFKVMRWSPHNMLIQYNPLTHGIEYRYRFPSHIKAKFKKGDKFLLRTTPWEMVDAIRQDKLFRFDKDRIYHMKEPTLAGLRTVGWGIPRLIANFKQAYYVQVLHRFNEALAIDYIVPFRLLTPDSSKSRVADPLLHQNLGMTKGHVMNMVAQHRRDPASWNFLPFPLQYQALGSEGMQMATHELLAAGNDELLNGMGVPADFYKGTLQLQVAPTALRLFERTWPQIPSNYSGWLTWAIRQIATIKNWEPASASMQSVTLADDLEKKQILLQLSAAREVSKGTAFGPFGIDYREEQKRIFDEMRQTSDLERDFQNEEAERAKMEEQLAMVEQAGGAVPPGGAMPPGGGAMPMGGGAMPMGGGAMPPGGAMGGAPMGGGGGTSMTPQTMMMQAEQLAQQLLGMPYEQRKSQMLQIKRSDEALHALVKSKMEQMRQQAGNQGKQMMQQQMSQQGPAM